VSTLARPVIKRNLLPPSSRSFVTAPTYVPVSLPPSLPPHMLSFHFVKDKMQVEKEIDYATEVTALEGKSTYEMLHDVA
jgi:hypothetical protein